MMCWQLEEETYFSGHGDEQGWLVMIYMEPKNEKKTRDWFKSLGAALADESTPVDPDTEEFEEMRMLYFVNDDGGQLVLMDPCQHEVVPAGHKPKKRANGAWASTSGGKWSNMFDHGTMEA